MMGEETQRQTSGTLHHTKCHITIIILIRRSSPCRKNAENTDNLC